MPTTHPMPQQQAYDAIFDYLQTIDTIDMHEHMGAFEPSRERLFRLEKS
jgi:hypothetical protein